MPRNVTVLDTLGTTRSGKPIVAAVYATEQAFRNTVKGWTEADHADATNTLLAKAHTVRGAKQEFYNGLMGAHFHAQRALSGQWGRLYTMGEAAVLALVAGRHLSQYEGVEDLGRPMGEENPSDYHRRMVEFHYRAVCSTQWSWMQKTHTLAMDAHEAARVAFAGMGPAFGPYALFAKTAEAATEAAKSVKA